MSPSFSRISLLVIGSGFCALVYQVAWLRLLRLIFGASTAASAAVLAIFMGGLGLGSLYLGRRADAERSPLAFYARLEMGIAISAAASPLVILLVRELNVALGGTAGLGPWAGTLVRLLLSAAVLGIPTFLMGGTLPAVARAVGRDTDESRRSVALLYGANTLGAVTGALVATFVSLELLGIRKSIWAASAVNLGVALAASALAWSHRSCDAEESGSPRPQAIGPESGRAPVGFVLAAAAVVGFAFLLMELVWYRMLAPILGGSSYTFGLILAVALLGIGLGGLVYAAGSPSRRPTVSGFAGTCSLEALLLAVPLALGDRLAVLAMLLRPLGDASFSLLCATWAVITAVVVLPAAIVSGYQFPLLVALLGSGRRRLGREVGSAYAWNTAGAILGSVAGGFGLLPLLTALGVWRGVVILLIALAGVSVALSRPPRSGPARAWLRSAAIPAALGLLGLALASGPGPTAFWRHTPIGAGRMPAAFDGPNELRDLVAEHRRSLIWEADGVESAVALEGQAQYVFLINGKADGSALRDAPNMVMSVLIGAALHPQPKRALVIGLGSGLSAGWLAEVDSIERVDVVELEPSVAEVARLCGPVNHDVLSHPKVNLVIGDGREFLLTTEGTYDLIFSQPSNPYRAGIASLFSREFYTGVDRRLNEGGLLLQWFQGYEVDAQVVRMAYATIGSVFPAVESWQVHENDLLLVAGREAPAHDLARIRSRLGREPFASALDWVWGVEGIEGFYSGYLGTPELAAMLAELHREDGGGLNSDDHPLMEFGFVRNLGREGLFHIDELRHLAETEGYDRPPGLAGGVSWSAVEDLRTVREVAWGGLPELPAGGADPAMTSRVRARRALRFGDLRQAFVDWSAQPLAPQSPLDRLLLSEASAEVADERSPELADELRARRPVDAEAVLARYDLRRGSLALASRHLLNVFESARDNPWVYPPTLARALTLADEVAAADPVRGAELFGAMGESFAVRLVEELRWRTRVKIASRLGDGARCVRALEDFEPHVPWEGKFLFDRFRCYRHAGHRLTERARRDVQRFLDDSPPRLETGLLPESGPSAE